MHTSTHINSPGHMLATIYWKTIHKNLDVDLNVLQSLRILPSPHLDYEASLKSYLREADTPTARKESDEVQSSYPVGTATRLNSKHEGSNDTFKVLRPTSVSTTQRETKLSEIFLSVSDT